MNQVNRLSKGGRLNRNEFISFRFNDKCYTGYLGDTLAAALLANGISLVSRSFKYHRPRGIFSAGSEEPNALVQLEKGRYTEPNRRATEIELYEGLVAHSQNCWPSVVFDIGSISSIICRLLPAGFYYKTFMWPQSLWMFYEKYIRKSSGIGISPKEIDPHNYDKSYAHCDVLIVGGGPAGLQAACIAGRSGAQIILVDEKNELGGSLLSESEKSIKINEVYVHNWLDSTTSELKSLNNVKILTRTTVTGYYDYNFLIANQRCTEHLGPQHMNNHLPKERLWKIRAKQVVLATGSIERPMVFADSDRPGVMLAGAIRTYINRFGVLPGNNIAILTNNDSAYHTALDAKNAGAKVVVIDVRQKTEGLLAKKASEMGINIITGSVISGVIYKKNRIKHIEIMSLSKDGKRTAGRKEIQLKNLIGVSGGWIPSVHLYSQAKGKLKFFQNQHCFIPDYDSYNTFNRNNPSFSAGACNATFDIEGCLREGIKAGLSAATAAGFSTDNFIQNIKCNKINYSKMRPIWILPCDHPIGKGKKQHFHELQNDSTVADIELAMREGFESIEHFKRYTTTGMGTDQGKISNMNALSVASNVKNVSISLLGTTTFRPPYTPLSFGSIVGHDKREIFLQTRKTAIHSWHDKQNVVYEDVGDWKRPMCFLKPGEDIYAAVQRESLSTRTSLGILDASTLGKIDLQGPDCKQLLNMLYTNAWSHLSPGKCRYGLMLNEHGMVFDDGVTTCLEENHYHMTTTTGGVSRVMNWIEELLQMEFPEMQVYATNVTEQWAVIALNGPNSRKLLEQLTNTAIDSESFSFMSMKEIVIAGILSRVFRISFTGELAFEINVPARYGLALWEILMEAGKQFNICPYGTESMHLLRAEKGFIIVGQDTDGSVTPIDLGMNWIVSKKKADFIGKRSLTRTDTIRSDRKQFVGLLTEDPNCVLQEGSHIVDTIKDKPPMKMLGHVTSSYMSPNLGRSIALSMIKDGFKRKGQTLHVPFLNGGGQKVTITDPIFFDKSGERAHG